MTSSVPTNQHYKLPEAQKKELWRQLLAIKANAPIDTEETGNSKPLPDKEKSKPVPDWWK